MHVPLPHTPSQRFPWGIAPRRYFRRTMTAYERTNERTNEREGLSPSLEAGKIASLKRRVGSRPSCSPLFRVAAFGSGRQRRLSDSVYFRVKFSPDRFAISRRIVLRTIHLLRAARACRNSANAPFTFDRSLTLLLPPPACRSSDLSRSPFSSNVSYFRLFRKFDLTGRRRVHISR